MHRRVLAEVPLEPHGADARVGVVEPLERRERPVRGAVVDVDELERAAEPVERRDGAAVELLDGRGFVEQRDDDGDVRSPLGLGLSRRCPQDVKLLHRRAPAYTPYTRPDVAAG